MLVTTLEIIATATSGTDLLSFKKDSAGNDTPTYAAGILNTWPARYTLTAPVDLQSGDTLYIDSDTLEALRVERAGVSIWTGARGY